MLNRIRTIQQCLCELKLLDNDTAVTENFIRFLCKTNKIKFFKSNSKYLVNYDDLLRYLGLTTNDEMNTANDSITF